MATKQTKTNENKNAKVVDAYFRYVHDLRRGDEAAIGKLLELWHPDGVFEFAGSPPVTGTFTGRNAIHALYRNRFLANGMPLKLDRAVKKGKNPPDVALGNVDTRIQRTKASCDRLVAAWTTQVATDDKRGFDVAGSHVFKFRDGRITSLRIVVSPTPNEAEGLRLDQLSVDDIGRLALAAWAVV